MKDFEYIKNGKLEKSCSPSSWLGVEYTLITRLHMSCGGGMGGSSWYEYVERLDNVPTNKMIKVKRYDGKEIYINTLYVVGAEDFTLAKVDLDITLWKYYPKTSVNDLVVKTHYVLIDDDIELKLM